MKNKNKKYKLIGYDPAPGMSKALRDIPRTATMPTMYGGIQAALPWSNGVFYWPTLDDATETDAYDRQAVMRGARYLWKNSGVIRKAIKDIWLLQGWLMPIPMTQDREWNKLARTAFLARVNTPQIVDVFGKFSWKTMQEWAEKMTSIDGDCLCVLAKGSDGGGMIAWYSSPKVADPENPTPEWHQGVKLNEQGRPIAYNLYVNSKKSIQIPAVSAILYQHDADPARQRGESELIHAIRHGIDIAEIHGFTKASVKLSAAVGFVETKSDVDKASGMSGVIGNKKKTSESSENPGQSFEVVTGGGARVVSLAPGRDLKAIYDQRPSPNVAAFIKDLLAEIAYGVGLDAEVLYNVNALSSAATRFVLARLKRWVENRMAVREEWANRVYRHIIALEMATGRLRQCDDIAWENVEWVGQRDFTIDLGREGSLKINLVREGLADADRFTLETEGMTAESLIERRAYFIARAHEIAAAHGVKMEELMPGSIGSTHQPHVTQSGDPPEDENPETTGETDNSEHS